MKINEYKPKFEIKVNWKRTFKDFFRESQKDKDLQITNEEFIKKIIESEKEFKEMEEIYFKNGEFTEQFYKEIEEIDKESEIK